jgi:superfamily II DNA/RNA helicase
VSALGLEALTCKLGRTGRFGRQGVAINFISDANSFRWVQELQQDLGVEITAVKTQDYEEMEKVRSVRIPSIFALTPLRLFRFSRVF